MELRGIRGAHIRFGCSSVRETLRALAILAEPAQPAEQVAWVRRARPLLTRKLKSEIRHFAFLFVGTPEVFPAVWTPDAKNDFAADVAKLRRSLRAYTDTVLIRLSGERLVDDARVKQLRKRSWYHGAAAAHAARDARTRSMLEEFVTSPRASLDRLCALLQTFYGQVMEPLLGPIDSRLQHDIAMRRDILRAHGAGALLRTLSQHVTAGRENARECSIRFSKADAVKTLTDGSTLTLVPSYFIWPRVQSFMMMRPKGGIDATIIYPLPALTARARGVANRSSVLRLLGALCEPSRLRIVELLTQRDLSTRELAGFLRTSEPAISRHLRVLHDAGAVERRRHSYFVLYRLRRDVLRDLIAALTDLTA